MAFTDFDKYFLNLPPLTKESDFYYFWKKSISDVKKIRIDPVITQNEKKSTNKFDVYNATYNGYLKTQLNATLLLPNHKKNSKVIIHIHDYNSSNNYNQQSLNNKTAYFFVALRGHNTIKTNNQNEQKSPGYLAEHILDIEKYYAKSVFLDVFRTVDVLRLIPELDCSGIGIMGKGFGATAAIFTAAFSPRIEALVLDTPSFCNLPISQNISTSDASNEINNFMKGRRNKKIQLQLKKNLSYFDALNFSDKIKCPVLTTVGFKDSISPPECVFSLFNHLLCEKIIEVFPDDGNEVGGKKQFQKSIKWLAERINNNNRKKKK